MNYISYNQQIIKGNINMPSFENRAFLYGDGIFETLISKNKKILFIEDHIERLTSALKAFKINKPSYLDDLFIEDTVNQLSKKNNIPHDSRIKINIWRKQGGLFTPTDNDAEVLVTCEPFIEGPIVKEQLYFYEEFRNYFSPVSRFKTINSAKYVLASLAKLDHQANDMILLDVNDHISECTASNIYFVKEEVLFTPSIQCGCVEGIMRKQILNICKNVPISIEIGTFNKEDILSANFAFTSNISGLSCIQKIDNKVFDTEAPIYTTIQNQLKNLF